MVAIVGTYSISAPEASQIYESSYCIYSLTSHPTGVKENHTGPASPVEHRGVEDVISCERHRGLAPTTGQREGCCSGCMV